MKNTAIVDAGPLIALFDQSDHYHQKAKQRLETYRKDNGILITTWPAVAEAAHLIRHRVHFQAQLDFLEWISLGGVEFFPLERDHLSRVIQLQSQYSNLPMDLADATLVVTAEISNIDKVFSIDRDFSIYHLPVKKHFHNLMK